MKTILVIDDKRQNLDLAQKQLGAICNLYLASTFSTAKKLLKSGKIDFDAVFTDVMLIGEEDGVSSDNPEIGKEVPYGLVIALYAKNIGIENVVLVTDLSHHSGPIAWALDVLKGSAFVNCIRNKNWLEAYTSCFKEFPKENTNSIKEIDFLVLGKGHEGYYDQLIQHFPDFKSGYLDVEEEFLETFFIMFNPKRTLILGEIAPEARGADYYVNSLFKKLLDLKNPSQKIIVAGFMSLDNPLYLELPALPKDFEKKFNKL